MTEERGVEACNWAWWDTNLDQSEEREEETQVLSSYLFPPCPASPTPVPCRPLRL